MHCLALPGHACEVGSMLTCRHVDNDRITTTMMTTTLDAGEAACGVLDQRQDEIWRGAQHHEGWVTLPGSGQQRISHACCQPELRDHGLLPVGSLYLPCPWAHCHIPATTFD